MDVTPGASGEALMTPRSGGIVLDGVRKVFGRGEEAVVAVDGVDLVVGEGEFVSIVGPSGCGKSTLLRMIVGLASTSAGRISIAGRPVTGPVTDCGVVFQQPVLLDWRTVIDNILFNIDMRGLDVAAHRPRAVELIELVGLLDFAGKRPYELSGGMKQRVAIARALVHRPPLLMMDEPFGALDALTREQMRIDLERNWLSTRQTVIFITHSIDEAVLLSDRVVVMTPRPGRLETTLDIALDGPRGIAARRHPAFAEAVEAITEIFLARGVLHRDPA